MVSGIGGSESLKKYFETLSAKLMQNMENVKQESNISNNYGSTNLSNIQLGEEIDEEPIIIADEANDIDSSQNANSSTESDNVEFSKTTIIDSSGLLSEYTSGSWSTGLCSFKEYGRNITNSGYKPSKDAAEQQVTEHATAVLNAIEQTLISQFGDAYTQEVADYVSAAKTAALADTGTWRTIEYQKGGSKKNKGYIATCNTQALVDKFFAEFDSRYQNNGKSAEEVQAEKDAQQKAFEEQKAGYKALYDLDIQETADEAGVSDITADSGLSNQEIKDKAESEILNSIKNKIREKLSGQNISDMDSILDTAASQALANPAKWAEMTDNYEYEINADKLIDLFSDAVKKAVKDKGYDF